MSVSQSLCFTSSHRIRTTLEQNPSFQQSSAGFQALNRSDLWAGERALPCLGEVRAVDAACLVSAPTSVRRRTLHPAGTLPAGTSSPRSGGDHPSGRGRLPRVPPRPFAAHLVGNHCPDGGHHGWCGALLGRAPPPPLRLRVGAGRHDLAGGVGDFDLDGGRERRTEECGGSRLSRTKKLPVTGVGLTTAFARFSHPTVPVQLARSRSLSPVTPNLQYITSKSVWKIEGRSKSSSLRYLGMFHPDLSYCSLRFKL